jgi:acyl-CoA thioesterase FadM
VAVADGVQVMYDYAAERPIPMSPEIAAAFERFEGRPLRD